MDTTNYNKLISDIIKQINDPNIKTDYKNYLLRVKEAIQIIYFPNTVEQKVPTLGILCQVTSFKTVESISSER